MSCEAVECHSPKDCSGKFSICKEIVSWLYYSFANSVSPIISLNIISQSFLPFCIAKLCNSLLHSKSQAKYPKACLSISPIKMCFKNETANFIPKPGIKLDANDSHPED